MSLLISKNLINLLLRAHGHSVAVLELLSSVHLTYQNKDIT